MKEKIYAIEELENLSEQELLDCLEDSWNIKSSNFEVWGEIKPLGKTIWGYLKNPRTVVDNKVLAYPLQGVEGSCEFYINPEDAQKFGDRYSTRFIRCKIELSPLTERKKHSIPFEMNIVPDSCSLLEKLPAQIPHDILTNNNKSFFISKSIFDFYHQKADIELQQSFEKIKAQQESELLEVRKNAEQNLQETLDQLSNEEKKLDNTIRINQSLDEIKQELDGVIKLLTFQKNEKQEKIIELEKQFSQLEVEMNHKIKHLKSYISEKALFLKTFEFIDEEDLESFLFEAKTQLKQVDCISFKNELKRNYKRAVSYIQAHLVENDILVMYPRG